MKMTIFDAASPGIPTEKPKGTIELTSVGEQFSAGRIIKTFKSTDLDPGRRYRLPRPPGHPISRCGSP